VLLQDEAEGFWGCVLDRVRLGRYPHDRGLSGGERQRVRLATVLAQAAEVVLLDEPLQHLDLRSRVAMLEVFGALARDAGKGVIMVLRDVYWASRYCDRTLLVFGDGRIAQGETGTVLNRENMEALYGCPLAMVEAGGGRLFLPTGDAR